jgi:hypothetical protein
LLNEANEKEEADVPMVMPWLDGMSTVHPLSSGRSNSLPLFQLSFPCFTGFKWDKSLTSFNDEDIDAIVTQETMSFDSNLAAANALVSQADELIKSFSDTIRQ